ncbi:hypothetical protein ACMFMG_004659 [Clarireedia jacksonii]
MFTPPSSGGSARAEKESRKRSRVSSSPEQDSPHNPNHDPVQYPVQQSPREKERWIEPQLHNRIVTPGPERLREPWEERVVRDFRAAQMRLPTRTTLRKLPVPHEIMFISIDVEKEYGRVLTARQVVETFNRFWRRFPMNGEERRERRERRERGAKRVKRGKGERVDEGRGKGEGEGRVKEGDKEVEEEEDESIPESILPRRVDADYEAEAEANERRYEYKDQEGYGYGSRDSRERGRESDGYFA